MGKELKVMIFAAVVCLVCSLLLAGVYSGLRPYQERNKALDVKVKVMTALGMDVLDDRGRLKKTTEEIEAMFEDRITPVVLDRDGKPVDIGITELTDEQVNKRNDEGYKAYYPLYVAADPESGRKLYAIHVSGRALWSVVKGYMALEDDGSTIVGMAFYEHQETPGLGGEIEKDFFQDRFKGKTFRKDGQVARFEIVKPGRPTTPHSIEGITAATMTCKGVADFLNEDYGVYDQYFEGLRK